MQPERAGPAAPPLFVLGVRRSGTTLLRVMLDRSSTLAVPDESYFVPQLATRHRGPIDRAAFLDDLRRVRRLLDLGITAEDVAPRLHDPRPLVGRGLRGRGRVDCGPVRRPSPSSRHTSLFERP